MSVVSAGILLYRERSGTVEVWIAHMGGPFWGRKDEHAWSIPKGIVEPGEDPFDAALREFSEEIGSPAPDCDYRLLGEFRQTSGKIVRAYVAEAPVGYDVEEVRSNTFSTEWPRGSGVLREFPEIDRAAWVGIDEAHIKLVAGQLALLDSLRERLAKEPNHNTPS